MLSGKSFFTFTELADPTRHRDYNAWHQLEHRPENLALPGVVFGERWVRTPECAATSPVADDCLAATQYMTIYWFAEPAERSIREWQELAERSFQYGSRPDVAYARRLLMGIFTLVKGYVSPRVRISPESLVFRPNRGLYVRVSRFPQPRSAAMQDWLAWQDRISIPQLVECPGVAGGWVFASDLTTLDPGSPDPLRSGSGDELQGVRGALRVLVLSLDEEPRQVLDELGRRSASLAPPDRLAGQAGEEVLLATTLRAIRAWEWDWFDALAGEQSP